jgi:hypothetical protein
MNRRGYLYVTADESKIADLETTSRTTSSVGAGSMRVHSSSALYYQPSPGEGFHNQPIGADLLIGNELIRRYSLYLTDLAVAALHVRWAGRLSAQQMGMYLLDRHAGTGSGLHPSKLRSSRVREMGQT